MLRDTEWREEFWIMGENLAGRLAAVKFAEQTGHGLDDERVGVADEETLSVLKLRGQSAVIIGPDRFLTRPTAW